MKRYVKCKSSIYDGSLEYIVKSRVEEAYDATRFAKAKTSYDEDIDTCDEIMRMLNDVLDYMSRHKFKHEGNFYH